MPSAGQLPKEKRNVLSHCKNQKPSQAISGCNGDTIKQRIYYHGLSSPTNITQLTFLYPHTYGV